MSKTLSNKVVFITGGGSWIGKEIAALFAYEGAKIFIVGREENKLKEAQHEIQKLGGEVSYCRADVSLEADIKEAVSQAISLYGKIDILIQNAGIYPLSLIEDMSLTDWKKVIDINLTGSFIVTKVISEIIKKQSSGRVIYISSIAGEEIGYPGLSHYSASKAGMNGLMRTAALELAKHNITVNSISPGNIANTKAFNVSEKQINAMIKKIPLKRVGHPQDVANLALFLASEASSFITGQNFVVDGGETISGGNISVDVLLNENS